MLSSNHNLNIFLINSRIMIIKSHKTKYPTAKIAKRSNIKKRNRTNRTNICSLLLHKINICSD